MASYRERTVEGNRPYGFAAHTPSARARMLRKRNIQSLLRKLQLSAYRPFKLHCPPDV